MSPACVHAAGDCKPCVAHECHVLAGHGAYAESTKEAMCCTTAITLPAPLHLMSPASCQMLLKPAVECTACLQFYKYSMSTVPQMETAPEIP